MSYLDVAELQQSEWLLRRLIAAVWVEVESANSAKWDDDPPGSANYITDNASAAIWVQDRTWQFAAQAGWAAAWAAGKALYGAGGSAPDAAKAANLGAQGDVITDGMILSAVQAINGEY